MHFLYFLVLLFNRFIVAKEDEQKVWKMVKSSINMKCRSATYNERKFG